MPTLLILLLTVATYASVWNGKTDTAWHNESETEFTITTPEQLAGFAELVNSGNNFEGKTVKLGANIMLNDTANWQSWANSQPANEWVPIGKKDDGKFDGIFDGNGFAVSGVYINSAKDYQGLFGYVGSGGAIKKLGVVASYIKGKYHIGGLVGYNHDGTISDSYFVGTITGDDNVGGLVGRNFGKVASSYSVGKVTGDEEVGGLVGNNSGTITNSYFSGEVIGERNEIGGLVGRNFGKVASSYSAGKVTGDEEVGGLVGSNGGSSSNGFIINSYSSSNVTGESFIGGLVGDNNGMVSNSYSSGDVTSKGSGGGLVGYNNHFIVNSYSIGTAISTGTLANKSYVEELVGINADKGIVINGYYMLSDRHDKQIIESENANAGIGKTTLEMQSKEFVDSLNFMAGLLSANTWVHSPGKYPVLSEQVASWPDISRFFASGNGTEANPYIISTKKHLENLAYFVNSGVDFLGKHFKLSQNIVVNAGWRLWIASLFASKWISIGKGERSFQGTFDGNGFAVSGIYINGNSGDIVGLFGALGSSGTIKNLGVTNTDIKTDNRAAGLVYYSEGTIINCYSTGRVVAKYDFAGGLVGYCDSSCRIISSYSTVSVSGQNSIGGLAGINEGFISGSYSTGKVNGKIHHLTQTLSDLRYLIPRRPNRSAGGLAGSNKGTIINSHSSSDVTGIEYVGGLVGSNEGTISGSYCTGKVNKNYLVGAGKEAVDSSYYCSEKK